MPTAGEFHGREHRLPARVYYEDTDFTGLVYHASYVRLFERGRTDALRLAGIGHADLFEREDPCAFAVIRLVAEFRRAARIDDALLIHTWFDSVQGPRLRIRQEITRAGDRIASAEVTAVCIRPGGAPRRPPPDMVAKLRPYLAPARP